MTWQLSKTWKTRTIRHHTWLKRKRETKVKCIIKVGIQKCINADVWGIIKYIISLHYFSEFWPHFGYKFEWCLAPIKLNIYLTYYITIYFWGVFNKDVMFSNFIKQFIITFQLIFENCCATKMLKSKTH